MKRAWMLCWLFWPAILHAEWKDLRAGMATPAVLQLVGRPLISSRGRVFETWTYDRGGSVVFVNGRVSWWTPPHDTRNGV